jgi:phosphatidylglycerol:prolipoprotein diacylglycerol transferase
LTGADHPILRESPEPDVPFPDIDPIAFQIGPFAVRWYALAYLSGILLGGAYGHAILRRNELWKDANPPFAAPAIWDLGLWAVIGIVIGGRLGYVLFYDLAYYLANPAGVFAFWDGGMSFHGGALGLMLATAIFTRVKGGSVLSAMDLLGCIAPIGVLLGRIANFINAELYGAPTALPWGVVFPTDPAHVPRHPTQLYEALFEGLLLFIVIRIATHRYFALRRPGLVVGIFAIGYAISRIAIEFVRVPDPQIGYLLGGWLTMGMVLTLVVLAFGIFFIALALRQPAAGGNPASR